jgi:hypothetical protein
MTYDHFDQLDIVELTLSNKGSEGSINIGIREGQSKYIPSLNRYLNSIDRVSQVKVKENVSITNQNTFFEIIYNQDDFSVLKWNYKKISKNESISLTRESFTRVFKKDTYYFSNGINEIRKFYFAKKSIQKGLAFVGKNDTENIPSLRNEEQLLDWLDKTF